MLVQWLSSFRKHLELCQGCLQRFFLPANEFGAYGRCWQRKMHHTTAPTHSSLEFQYNNGAQIDEVISLSHLATNTSTIVASRSPSESPSEWSRVCFPQTGKKTRHTRPRKHISELLLKDSVRMVSADRTNYISSAIFRRWLPNGFENNR